MSGHTAPSQGTVRAVQAIAGHEHVIARCSVSGLPSRYAPKRAPLARGPQDGEVSPMGVPTVTDSAVRAGSTTLPSGGQQGGERWKTACTTVDHRGTVPAVLRAFDKPTRTRCARRPLLSIAPAVFLFVRRPGPAGGTEETPGD